MRTLVFCLVAMFAATINAEEQYTIDSVQTYFDQCAAEGKPIDAPPLRLTSQSMPGHVGRLTTPHNEVRIMFVVVQQIEEGTIVNVRHFASPRNYNASAGKVGTIPMIDKTVGTFLFKFPAVATFATDTLIWPDGIWHITGTYTYNTAIGGSRTVCVVEELPDNVIDVPKEMPHQFLYKYPSRDWKKSGGDLLTRGVYVGYRGGSVWIMDKESEIIKQPLTRLSAEDQLFVRKEIRQQRREHLIPELERQWKQAGINQ